MSDLEMPDCLNMWEKQSQKAAEIAALHSQAVAVKRVRAPNPQGFASRTVIATLANHKEVVIQFRREPMDLGAFVLAQKTLGAIVPTIELIQDEDLSRAGIWTYCMTCISGKSWIAAADERSASTRVTVLKSLGRALSKSFIAETSETAIEQHVRLHLQLLLASKVTNVCKFHPLADRLYQRLDDLKTLPLFVSLFDLNDMNVMVDENLEVSGIVDWELSTPLPFGMGFCRTHLLAGEIYKRNLIIPDDFEEAERGLWQAVWNGLSDHVRHICGENADLVQTAVTLGTLLDTFRLVDGQLAPTCRDTEVTVPTLLSYRIPIR
ncbi:hypothetical protein ANO11243_030170 [Dothideomycetidae sp. 11243]|nr:hypothetical protein ANO11243_030170 [fungal sp. No.11243]